MKVTVVQGGGFGGLVLTTTADTAALPLDDAIRLREAARGFSELPATVGGPGHADQLLTEITVEDDEGKSHTVRFAEDERLGRLVALVRAMGGRDG
ncbi:protealysin inhibitor emfourin [Nonomuraea sp. NPDC050663]|uniref:protealysin inhibitor emfourin n=1 Tax=Nonomuraea sp. NPDC050663 TaxID=3364370 RepID=UPI0037A7B1EB